MQVRVGVDIVEVERIERAVARHGERFLRRVFSPRELDYCAGRLASLAARFAAKEAVSKALGTGIGAVRWRDIEVLPDPGGRPVVHLHGEARRLVDPTCAGCEVSISHSRAYAVASAVVYRHADG